jgi:hypothetical protein
MLNRPLSLSLLAASALVLAAASPALAGTTDHAREAVAAAQTEVQTAEGLNAGAVSPGEMAQARALAANAKADFKAGDEERAIREANEAQAFADTAIAAAQKHKDEAVAAARANARATSADAQAQVAAAEAQTAAEHQQLLAARQQAAQAEQQAANADARADAAQQAAAVSAADAAAANVQTTVTTTQEATNTRHPVHRKVVTTATSAPTPVTTDQVTTTTKVTPQ